MIRTEAFRETVITSEAIQRAAALDEKAGLLRFARNDGDAGCPTRSTGKALKGAIGADSGSMLLARVTARRRREPQPANPRGPVTAQGFQAQASITRSLGKS